jgi:hypothetical protein
MITACSARAVYAVKTIAFQISCMRGQECGIKKYVRRGRWGHTRRLWGSPWRRNWMLRESRVSSCTQLRSEPAHQGTSNVAPRQAHARVKTGRAVIGARKGCWGLSSPRAGGGSGMSGRGVCGRRTRAAERSRTWTRMSGGYCFGIAFGRDTSSISADSKGAGGFDFWAPSPEAIFLRALRRVAMFIRAKTREKRKRSTCYSISATGT